MSYLIITGSFACGMAFHNTTARYAYSLGREGMLPPVLGKTHPRWQSPHIASIAASVLSLIIIGLFAIFVGTNDPSSQAYGQLYGLMAVMGVIIILSVQAVVSLAILVYYLRFHRDEVHWWKTRARPGAGAAHPGVRRLPAVQEHRLPRRGLRLRQAASARSTPPVVADRHRAGLLLQEVQAETFEKVGRLINEGL